MGSANWMGVGMKHGVMLYPAGVVVCYGYGF